MTQHSPATKAKPWHAPVRRPADVPSREPAAGEESPAIRGRELLLVLAGAVALAVVTTWPLVLHLDRDVAQDLGDPIRTAWQVAWEGHALLTQPLAFFQANAFYPLPDSLAFSDSLIGYAPATLVGDGPAAALVRYNLLFLLAQALPFAGVFLLARELGAGRAGSAVAGAAFAYAPFRLAMNGHLHVVSSGGIPLALFLLLRGYRRRRPGLVAAGWLVAAWQLSLGFTLGLQLVYLLGVLGVIVLATARRRLRPAASRPVIAATVVGLVFVAAVGAVQARPYLRVAETYASAERSADQVRHYSPPLRGYLAAPPESRVWGAATAPVRESLRATRESSLFPGAAIVVLALLGVVARRSPYSRKLRFGLAAGTLAVAVLAMGFGFAGGWLGYRWLYGLAPGWDAVRTPGRLTTTTSLGLALLAGAGAHALVRAAEGARERSRGPALGSAAFAVVPVALVGLVLLDGAGRVPHPTAPPAPARVLSQPHPQLHLPSNDVYDRLYMLWSTEGFPQIANGVSTFSLPPLTRLRRAVRRFPDPRSVALLRRMGIRTVVVHRGLDRLPFPPAGRRPVRSREQAARAPGAGEREVRRILARPTAGLGLHREWLGETVVFHVEPRPAARIEP